MNLIFSINLDPLMVDHPHFETLLRWYRLDLMHNIIFEINETTHAGSLSKLKLLQVDFDLRYSADDLNSWDKGIRDALIERVEMTKLDCRAFARAMEARADDPLETIYLLREHKISDKPLIVEGVRETDFRFLERYWEFPRQGALWGQGQQIDCGPPWDDVIVPLKPYGLDGCFLRRRPGLRNLDADEDELRTERNEIGIGNRVASDHIPYRVER